MMKKIIISAIILFFAINIAFSQSKPFRFGIRLSSNISWYKPMVDDYMNEGPLMGFGWGFISDFTLADNYYISTGFDVVFNNGKMSFPYLSEVYGTIGTLQRRYNIRYLQVPVVLKMRTNKFGDFAYFGKLGFGGGFKIGAKSKDYFEFYDEDDQYNKTEEVEINLNDEIQLFKGSILIGLGTEYFIDESTSLTAGINYNNGFTNILTTNSTVEPDIKEKAQIYYIELVVGVIF